MSWTHDTYWSIRRWLGAIRRRRELVRWLASHARNGSNIHHAIFFTGRDRPFLAAEIDDPVIIEQLVNFHITSEPGKQPRLRIGAHAFIGMGTFVQVFDAVSIGRYALIGPYCYIVSANHQFDRRDAPIQQQGFATAPVTIGEDAWLGTHVVVMPGVSIGKGAIIGAGSVVTRNVPEYEIWAGVPARFVKNRPG